MNQSIVLSINTAWNFVNFRSGLIRHLVAEGYEVIALAPPDINVGRIEALGAKFVPIAMDRKGLSPLADLALLRAYRQHLRRIAPVAFLGWTIKPNIWGSLAAASLGIPVLNNISGLGTAFMKAGPLQMVVRTLYRVALRRSATVFFQNPSDRDSFAAMKLVRPDQAALLPGSGIDTTVFAPPADVRSRREENNEEPVRFLMVARLLADKGIREYVTSARLLRREGLNARFVILGGLDPDNRSAIGADELAAWINEGAIEHLPQTDDVRPALAAADCVVLPSYREGMPRSLLEGAAMARPLISSDVPGCVQIARAGENAFVCPAKNVGALANAMRKMANLPISERQAMGMAGRRIVEREFDETIVIDNYLRALSVATGR